jgi:uncharacterized protein YbaP (TraB family)
MPISRLAIAGTILVLSLALWPGGDVLAKRKRVEACQGIDLIARLAQTDPIGHRRIVTRAVDTENSQAIFWLIEKEGLEPSYLLGTVHLSDDRLKRLPVAAEMALERAEQLAVETYFDSEETVESVLGSMNAPAVTSPSHRLSEHLSEVELTRLERLAKDARLARDELDQLNPWVAEMLIRGQSCEARRIEQGELVLDAWVAGRAVRQGIALKKLETVGEQFETLAAIPYASQIAMLRYALTERPTSADDEMETMIGLYLRRQIPAADALTRMLAPDGAAASAYLAAFWEHLIRLRNLRFLGNAKPLIERGRVFIAVGAAHLPGERGMVRLLRDAGFKVTAVDEGSGSEPVLAALGETRPKAKQKVRRKSAKLAAIAKRAPANLNKHDRTAARK